MIVDLGEEPRNKNATFTVAANIYSEQDIFAEMRKGKELKLIESV